MTAPLDPRDRDRPYWIAATPPGEKPAGYYTRRFELGMAGLAIVFIAWMLLRVGLAWADGRFPH